MTASIGTWGGVEKAGTRKKERKTWGKEEKDLNFRQSCLDSLRCSHAARLTKRQLIAQKTSPTQQPGQLPFLPACMAQGLLKELGRKEQVRGRTADGSPCST